VHLGRARNPDNELPFHRKRVCRTLESPLWNTTTGTLTATLTGHTDWVYHVAFGPDGTTLATASWDNTASFWNMTFLSRAALREKACGIAGRNLTRAEWERFLPGKPMKKLVPVACQQEKLTISVPMIWEVLAGSASFPVLFHPG